MIERDIKDTDKYEAKLIGPLSTRQTIFGAIGLGLAVTAFFLTRDALGDAAIFIGVLVAFPFLLCGFYKPHQIPFERFAKSVLINMFFAPTKRRYKTENTYDETFRRKTPVTKQKKYQSSDKNHRRI